MFLAILFNRYKVTTGEGFNGLMQTEREYAMAIMHLTVIPLGTGSPSVGDYVAEIQKILSKSGFPFELTDMGTIIEGKTEDLLQLAAELAQVPFASGINRVVTQISLDDRRDKKVAIGTKKASVAERLQESDKG